MPRDLLVFGEDWGGLPSSTQHLVRHLANDRKVLWVNSIGLRRPRFGWRDTRRIVRKLGAARIKRHDAPAIASAPFRILDPLTLPAPRTRITRELAAGILAPRLRRAMVEEGMHHPLMWTALPTAVDLAGRLGESGLVYYCGDDFGALAGVDHGTVTRRENELVQRADLVLAASETLAFKHAGERTRLLPHGVDLELFCTPVPRASDLPDDGRPIAGFYGSISEWLDVDMVAETARRLPDWHFVFIGKPVIDTTALQRLPNVRFLGERPHAALPAYSQHWNVSLMPFRDTPQIRACNPLKLREYLAAGRPVVTTDFPAMHEYAHLVYRVDHAAAMTDALRACAGLPASSAQVDAVAAHDWANRADQVATWLEAL